MRIVEPSFEIRKIHTREDGIALLREVEYYARISHRSEEAQTAYSWERFLKLVLMSKGDWSVAEHEKVTVIVRVDRGVTHEWVRHRIGSYTQESTRFVNYGKKEIEFIEPEWSGEEKLGRDVSSGRPWEWVNAMERAETAYLRLLEGGATPQIARSVLPNATASTIAVTYNLRSWRQFFMMRTTRESHPDFRKITIPMLAAFKERIPLLYDDIVPEVKQSISLSRPR